ncbi:YggS family pyridoxal phosphate-dependent enzyme [Actinokineospora bangkokensis]|uniref:Pyridoxal phosphate homeostasis protein n=1 Tax=Actinokineospora bangkokensis TaxID=1193682 RepID=A0A1Q9LQ96_9PSEU|nr:YggS family pyridoxal phosphate-dependent enzyme [Actinokineospora bangkokensis]OLR94199.1 YggS family pyridoxal phosphate enzyme [Actinokineospora bangkokensis]
MTAGRTEPGSGRSAEVAANLAEVRARIEAACAAAGRDPAGVRLLGVSKTWPASDAVALAELGVLDLAENREQEAGPKAALIGAERPDLAIRWHMVGQLQRNKARAVARWAHEVQSVDSVRLAEALHRAVGNAQDAGERADPLDVLIQVSLDDDPARGGCPVDGIGELAEVITRSSGLRLRGIMAVAPLGGRPEAAFARLASAGERLRETYPTASELSCGMSNDLEAAIEYGSTCVRVGTALLGRRGLAFR